jgi:hypothetical protein
MGCTSSKEAGGVAAQSGPAAHKNNHKSYSSLFPPSSPIKQQTKSNEDNDIMVRVMPMFVWTAVTYSRLLLVPSVGGS